MAEHQVSNLVLQGKFEDQYLPIYARYTRQEYEVETVHQVLGTLVHSPSGYLVELAESLLDPPLLDITGRQQDEIASGQPISDDDEITDGIYLDEMLGALGWWTQAANSAIADGAAESRKTKLLSLLGDVLAAYPAALAQSLPFHPDELDIKPAATLITRYRRFTRFVCDLAEETWPEVNLTSLRKLH